MQLNTILRSRYQILQCLESDRFGEIALSIFLAENLEIPITPKPLCVIYSWQVSEQDALDHEAIAVKLYEIGQKYTLAPRVQAFFIENETHYLVREYQEGYEYLEEFSEIIDELLSKCAPWRRAFPAR